MVPSIVTGGSVRKPGDSLVAGHLDFQHVSLTLLGPVGGRRGCQLPNSPARMSELVCTPATPDRSRVGPSAPPHRAPFLSRLVGALLVEINDEMIAAERYIAATSVVDLTGATAELALPAPPRH